MGQPSDKKLPSIKSLIKKALELWKSICYLRDGKRCMVKYHFPEIQIKHTNIFQVDHCFKRGDHNLFIDPSNGTVVCSACNSAKHWHNKGVDLAIYKIVEKREGIERFQEMLKVHQSMTPNIHYKKRWWIEEEICKLEDALALMKINKGIGRDLKTGLFK